MNCLNRIIFCQLSLFIESYQIKFLDKLLAIDDQLERDFYLQQILHENWTYRELRRQKKTALFHRYALSRDKEGILLLAKEGMKPELPEDLVREPYVLEFLKIPEDSLYN